MHRLIVIKTPLFYLDKIICDDVILCVHDFPVCSFNPAFRGCQNPINGLCDVTSPLKRLSAVQIVSACVRQSACSHVTDDDTVNMAAAR